MAQVDDKTIQMPCCPAICHTICYFQSITVSQITTCIFCATLLAPHPSATFYDSGPETDAPNETPEFIADARALKKTVAAEKKALTGLRQIIREAARTFNAQAAPLIASLKGAKREAILGAKLTEEWRTCVSTTRRTTASINRFMKKYNVGRWFLRSRRMISWSASPMGIVRRKFRIRI